MSKRNVRLTASTDAGTGVLQLLSFSVLTSAAIATLTVFVASSPPSGEPTATLLVTGLDGALGSTIGPGGALYVTEGAAGRVSRVDPQTGEVTTFASGLPTALPEIGLGGAMDVAFVGGTAYVLVTLVGPSVLGNDGDIVGIYRVTPHSITPFVDIGAFALQNPPPPDIDFVNPTGLQYALEPYRGGFLVTDGHHNRVLHVTIDGEVRSFMQFDNIVPTGLALSGNTVYMAEAGPLPHLPENGKVVMFRPKSPTVTEVASGAPLLVDVEFGRGRTMYALSQGVWDGPFEGSPALPSSGALVKVKGFACTPRPRSRSRICAIGHWHPPPARGTRRVGRGISAGRRRRG